MLGAVYGGQVAARTAAAESDDDNTASEETRTDETTGIIQPPGIPEEAARLMRDSLGIFRSGEKLEEAAGRMQELISAETDAVQKNRMILGRAVLLGALNRRESRGAHTRTDHPERDDKSFRKTTIVVYDGKEIKVSLRDIPEKRGEEQ